MRSYGGEPAIGGNDAVVSDGFWLGRYLGVLTGNERNGSGLRGVLSKVNGKLSNNLDANVLPAISRWIPVPV